MAKPAKVALVVVAVLAGGLVAARQLSDRPPAFRRGGHFAAVAPPPAAAARAAVAPTVTSASLPVTTAGSTTATEARSASAPGTSRPPATVPAAGEAPAPTGPTAGEMRAAGRSEAGPAAADDDSDGTGAAATSGAASPAAAGPARPAPGSYLYAVDGEEKASFTGSRRFPDRMTTVVHSAAGLRAEQLVFDIRYSEDHWERQVIGYRADGVYCDYEAGSIRFGPVRGTSEVDFDPPIPHVPVPAAAGGVRSGSSRARRADGSVARTEEWRVAVLGREPVGVGGTPVDAWKLHLERRTAAGSSEKLAVQLTGWYDAGRGLWLRFDKTIHGERPGPGVTLTYDARLTAVLVDLNPAGETG